MEHVLEAKGLTKQYGDRVILRDLSLTLPRGSLALVTGRSGSGKSTLFKLLAGLDRPTRGELRVEGRDVATLDEDALADLRLHRLGLVFQSFNLLPNLTVEENVRLPLQIAGRSRAEATARAREVLALLGIDPLADKRPGTLSGGEQQRTAIARALTLKPALLLADEPTGSLDRANAENVLQAFRDVNRTLRTTVLIITHDPLLIDSVPDRYELEDGILRAPQGSGNPALQPRAERPG